MNNIETIVNEMIVINSDLSTHTVRLQREQGEITNTMNKVQRTFGDQQSGQILVSTLYRTLQNVITAESSLNNLKQEINNYINNIQK